MATGLTKTALTRQMAEKLELTNKQAGAFLDLLAETAIKETKKNGVFIIPGVGRLVKAERKARIGRNPQTGQPIKISERRVLTFKASQILKQALNDRDMPGGTNGGTTLAAATSGDSTATED